MGIINGTFNTDLSGWSISAVPDRYGVVWDNGKAKLWNGPFCTGSVANLYQDFIIDNKILSFDWWSSGTRIYGTIVYSISVFIEGQGWISVAGRELVVGTML